jgi:hypothetical protein
VDVHDGMKAFVIVRSRTNLLNRNSLFKKSFLSLEVLLIDTDTRQSLVSLCFSAIFVEKIDCRRRRGLPSWYGTWYTVQVPYLVSCTCIMYHVPFLVPGIINHQSSGFVTRDVE